MTTTPASTQSAAVAKPALHVPANPVRVVTAASLFDGHDAAITIMRRILQSQGAEVIHLGHNRSVAEVVEAAITEDAQAVAISSYQGGHVEYFSYLVSALAEAGVGATDDRPGVRVYGGGGGVIVPEEIELLAQRGVRIFSPADGQRLGLAAMVNTILAECDHDLSLFPPDRYDDVLTGDRRALARALTVAEAGGLPEQVRESLRVSSEHVPVLGITGTGGSGKSSLTDELVRRFTMDTGGKVRLAVLAIDPTRRRGGGALLGDRIRMNSLTGHDSGVFFRSMATRGGADGLPAHLDDVLLLLRASGVDAVILETPGIGQGDAGVVPFSDVSLYLMTPEYGASSQLEKIDMLEFADAVAINKFERRGAADARRDVARQLVRNREAFGTSPDEMPVFGTSAATFNDDGVTALYQFLRDALGEHGMSVPDGQLGEVSGKVSSTINTVLPADRVRYLSEVATAVRGYHAHTREQAERLRRWEALSVAARELSTAQPEASTVVGSPAAALADLAQSAHAECDPQAVGLVESWPLTVQEYTGDELVVRVRDREIHTPLRRKTLSENTVPRVAVPRLHHADSIYTFQRAENLPGRFPFTAGVFPFKREGEDPARMFAGEGDPARTNRRFHYLSQGAPATRLSTAFDSVTLYGIDPALRPDIYGKVGTSGVSVATLDDMRDLYAGFDLTDPSTSVSMTINGPAPTILAFYLNAAIDAEVAKVAQASGRAADEVDEAERAQVAASTLAAVRGTVQADILKEDQGQNTCIFSTEFSLRMMGDIQEWFIANDVRNFYSVSISGYHIAEAGANPISQLAFTLANGFTYVESYLARGMRIDDFAPNLSFFFSNGMDAEYTVIGRVARRIWAIAMRDLYGASERSQKLKYHVQTSGRSLHAQEMDFNDIRTTLQALCALYDNANSLHTNAYDEAITTPTDHSVRRALAIQLIINREWGLSMNENPLQGSFVVEELTDLVEEAVLAELDRITERGGVLGAMETGYQRGKIQDESMVYEQRKHDGSLPLIGVNTFLDPDPAPAPEIELARGTEAEKRSQLARLEDFQSRNAESAPAALARLKAAATSGENVFAVLMDTARVCSLGQITEAFFEVGGQYRRAM
ncbi:MAG: fused isobutyryl-CoA mutase/GTPase IcmF [Actinomycetales bacterium]